MYASAYNNRDSVWLQRGEYARARDDFGEAIRLNPRYGEAFANRGFIHFYQGSFALAARDFSFARELAPQNAYAAIWQLLSRARSTRGPRTQSPTKDATIAPDTWPWPVVRFLTGNLSVEELTRAAAHPDAAVQRSRRCEMNFYIGQSYLARGLEKRAIESLEQARAACPKDFVEYHGAVAELVRFQRVEPRP